MSIFSNIQDRFYQQAIKKELKYAKKNHIPMNLNMATDIAVLIDISSSVHSIVNTAVFEYIDQLKIMGKEVKILAFTSKKKIPESLEFECLCAKDLSWYLAPQRKKLEPLLRKQYDIIFSLYTNPSKPLDYITKVSKAHLKVGYYDPNKTDILDLMVHNADKDFQKALEQIHQTLLSINK
jgi:hypothetical protein